MASEIEQTWNDFPWKIIDLDVYSRMPTFVFAELCFGVVAICGLLHAIFAQRKKSKKYNSHCERHVLLWFSALFGGIGNDIFFMWLPLVDNFWHSQATFMITPRFPFYILCIYIIFLYFPIVCIWRLRLPRLAESAITGIAAAIFYAPFDIVGIKFLWWTWHDTDTTILQRFMGVPFASTMWVATFSFVFSFLFRTGLPINASKRLNIMEISRIICLVVLFGVPSMMLHMTIIQCTIGWSLPPPPAPNATMLIATFILYLVFALVSILSQQLNKNKIINHRKNDINSNNVFLILGIIIYFIFLISCALIGDPSNHTSVGIHQTYGPCDVNATDWSGSIRSKYLCSKKNSLDFTFDCDGVEGLPTYYQQWYTICGQKKESYWVIISVMISLFGACIFIILLILGSYLLMRDSYHRKNKSE